MSDPVDLPMPHVGGYEIPPNSRGVIALDAAACTSCMLCVRECPDWCITLEAHLEDDADAIGRPAGGSAAGGGRGKRTKLVLDAFEIDYSLCMYCGICIEVCPFDALAWAPSNHLAAESPVDLMAPIETLERWWPTPKTRAPETP